MEKFREKYSLPSPRASWWDYRRNAAYFITINTRKGLHFFGEILSEKMVLTDIGEVVEEYWLEIPKHFPFVKLGVYVVMPNHMHGILIIEKSDVFLEKLRSGSVETVTEGSVETLHATSLHGNEIPTSGKNKKMASISPKRGSLGSIIRSFKSAVTTTVRKTGDNAFAWQPRYYDHIIRDRADYKRIENYILNNPKNWDLDQFNDKRK